MGDTKIQWTDKSWSPLRSQVKQNAAEIATAKGYTSLIQIATRMAGHIGPHCEHVSHGCDNCYSDSNNGRCLPANGTGLPFDRRSRDLVTPIVDENILRQPLSWKKPVKIFVENQSDLFGEWVTDEQIDRVFAVMALCPQHTFQVLTKRPIRMINWMCDARSSLRFDEVRKAAALMGNGMQPKWSWPLPNVWLGVSVEDQKTADTRIPVLLKTAAAIRFVSYEPALGPVDFSAIKHQIDGESFETCSVFEGNDGFGQSASRKKINQVIVGGESGAGARPFDIAWARNTISQCKEAGAACFVKQLGRNPIMSRDADGAFCPDYEFWLKDRKGGDMAEWPEDLRVREFPEVAHAL